MNNYYTEIIESIQNHIDQKEYDQALEKLIVELSMPYIPDDSKVKFESLLREIKALEPQKSSLLTDIETIKDAFLMSEDMKIKALNSMESLNLRPYLEDIQDILNLEMDDMMKRMVLMIALEQDLDFTYDVTLEGEQHRINLKEIENPFTHPHYQKVYMDLNDMLGSYDPSLLKLCLDELNLNIMAHFPFIHETLSATEILEVVNSYMHKG